VLADFQQALADFTASPALCRALRADLAILEGRYTLTMRERERLVAIIRHAGMSAACTVYRMNRIAPLAMNLRATLQALGPASRDLVEAYWRDHPRGHAHFFIESDRFCRWLVERMDETFLRSEPFASDFGRESVAVRQAIAESAANLDPVTAAASQAPPHASHG
jgi:hypothetical protein